MKKDKPYGFIYMTTNTLNQKKYIGKHTSFNDDYLGSGKILNMAIKKYGRENFSREIIQVCYSLEELNEREKYWIDFYNAVESKKFYNIASGGDGGDIFSKLPLERQLELRKKFKEQCTGKGNPMFGKTHSIETRNKMIKNKDYNKYRTDEFRRIMSEATSGDKNGMYGRSHSIESRIKMSESRKGKQLGEENGMYGKTGENAVNGKQVYQYKDSNHEILINTFNTVGCALEYLNLKGHVGLYKAIKENKLYKGYYWSK